MLNRNNLKLISTLNTVLKLLVSDKQYTLEMPYDHPLRNQKEQTDPVPSVHTSLIELVLPLLNMHPS